MAEIRLFPICHDLEENGDVRPLVNYLRSGGLLNSETLQWLADALDPDLDQRLKLVSKITDQGARNKLTRDFEIYEKYLKLDDEGVKKLAIHAQLAQEYGRSSARIKRIISEIKKISGEVSE